MRRALIALAAAVGATLVAPGPWTAVGSPLTRGAPLSRCTAHRGTIVAVDFAAWGGPLVRGCTVHQSTAYRLLHDAGFTTAGDQHDGPAVICRVGDSVFEHGTQYPRPSQQACVLTPPASAYWSYWLAPANRNRWEYSQLGAMSEVPKPGEVELWIFGATNIAGTRGSAVPTFTPDAVRATHDGSTVGSGGPRVADALPTRLSTSSGSIVALVIGVCLAVALCVGAGAAVWRRRRYE